MPLVATIASINVEDNSMMVTLTDTSEEEDVHINDWLVEQKLAEHGKMGDKVEMNNLLLYVEENLMYSPEKCYESETSVPDNHSKESTKESVNAPLILPQSTLEDTYFKTALESKKSQNQPSIAEENNSICINNIHTFAKNYTTNPFLQDTPAYNEVDLNPKKLMQLWTDNLQLQMQITTTLNMLFNKVLNDTSKSEKGNLTKGENVNTSYTFSHTNDISLANLTDINMSNICQDATFSNANIYNENLNINIHSDPFQNTNVQNTVCNFNEEVAKNIRTPPGYEKYNNKLKFDEQYLARDINTNITTADNFLYSYTPFKETNPFRLSLAGKMKISDSQEGNSSNSIAVSSILHENQNLISEYDSILQRFVENGKTSTPEIPENACKDTLFNQSQRCLNNASSNTSNLKNESFALNAKPLPSEHNWNIDNVSNMMSNVMINNQHVQHAAQKSKEIEKHTEQYSFLETGTKEAKDLNLEPRSLSLTENQSNEKFAYDLNKCRFPAKVPANNLASSTLINNANFDEGYFTCPSTSHNSYASSPLLQLNINKSECSQQLLSENVNESSETWAKSFQNTVQLNDWNKTAFLFKKSEQTVANPKNQPHHSMKNTDTVSNAGSLVNNESASMQSSYSKGNQLKNIKCMSSSDHVVFFQVFELPTSLVHIFHYQGEGWLLTDEFIKTFTKFESTSYAVILLYTLNIHVQYKQVDRNICPLKFINVGSTLSKTTQQIINDKGNIHLVRLKSVIEILDKLEIISKEDTSSILTNDSVIQDIWFSLQMINNAYRNLKYHIESAE